MTENNTGQSRWAEVAKEIPEFTLGVDLENRRSHYCLLNRAGEISSEGRVRTREVEMTALLQGHEAMRVAMEIGAHSPWVSRLAMRMGHEVIVANPWRLRAIYENPTKDDERDAQMLARLARVDPRLLYPVEHRSEQEQQDMAVLRLRDGLVRGRARWVNQVR